MDLGYYYAVSKRFKANVLPCLHWFSSCWRRSLASSARLGLASGGEGGYKLDTSSCRWNSPDSILVAALGKVLRISVDKENEIKERGTFSWPHMRYEFNLWKIYWWFLLSVQFYKYEINKLLCLFNIII